MNFLPIDLIQKPPAKQAPATPKKRVLRPRGGAGAGNRIPNFFDKLNESDKEKYLTLQNHIDVYTRRTLQKHLADKFKSILGLVQNYINEGQEGDVDRSLVVGFALLNDDLCAISTKQLATLIGKCKSSINLGFTTLGMKPSQIELAYIKLLINRFPFMNDDCALSRQWTFRVKIPDAPPLSHSIYAAPSLLVDIESLNMNNEKNIYNSDPKIDDNSMVEEDNNQNVEVLSQRLNVTYPTGDSNQSIEIPQLNNTNQVSDKKPFPVIAKLLYEIQNPPPKLIFPTLNPLNIGQPHQQPHKI